MLAAAAAPSAPAMLLSAAAPDPNAAETAADAADDRYMIRAPVRKSWFYERPPSEDDTSHLIYVLRCWVRLSDKERPQRVSAETGANVFPTEVARVRGAYRLAALAGAFVDAYARKCGPPPAAYAGYDPPTDQTCLDALSRAFGAEHHVRRAADTLAALLAFVRGDMLCMRGGDRLVKRDVYNLVRSFADAFPVAEPVGGAEGAYGVQ